ncbi:hypothetical protein HHI36_016434 [Cryptolaemus montrouzieri]|uniref:WD repeat domain phosphoinositide-interacting protein 4 n=1 Tax=Cryptolaemus montrouzieri TaxID=559131 RepID=A0ABD2NJP9_9CUCU
MASDRKILNLKFNQDHGCFTCCMESGVRIYNVEPLCEKTHYYIDMVGSVSQCEMIYRTNLIGIVSGGSRPKFADNVLLIYDDSAKKFILEITFSSSIRAFRMRRDKLIVALLNKIHVFSFPTPTQKLFSMETRPNIRGLLEVSPLANCEKQVLVFPGHKVGTLQVVDLANTEVGCSSSPVYIQAHQSDLSCVALNQQGTKVATTSIKGTLIRVWDTSTRTQLVELRRGSDPAIIFSINFNQTSDYLCCSSDKGTVHIFAIKRTNLNKRMSIPNILGKYGESQWAFANFTVPPECACVCAFGKNNTVIAIGMDGTFHQYGFNSEGTCNREIFDIFLDVCDDDIVL